VLAIALDTVAAAAECGDALVVTPDPAVRAAVTALGPPGWTIPATA